MIRGALGFVLSEEYFRPRRAEGPSGLRDAPRPFVLRVRELDGRAFEEGEEFEIGLHLFALELGGVFRDALQCMAEAGVGRGRVKLNWLGCDAQTVRCELAAGADRRRDSAPENALACALPDGRGAETERGECEALRVEFLSPTELKGWDRQGLPPFEVLLARVRDRASALQALYGPGEPELDFSGLGERAKAVRTSGGRVEWVSGERTSARTGQRHPLGGFRGHVEYDGELGEFMPLLRTACWTGVGRQTVWGHGEIALD